MTNVFDYLRWRGDLSFDQSPWNEVDGMILARLSYLPYEGRVGVNVREGVALEQAAQRLLAEEDLGERVMCREDIELLKAAGESVRFGGMRLSGYVNYIDQRTQTQFSALAISIRKDWHVISFRGTDDTLVGWKEDFNMSFTCPVPAQKRSVVYLEMAAGELPGRLMLTGHSKGGNLAVYAASFCALRVQGRITEIWNYDGPGFQPRVLQSPGYLQICSRVRTFVPQSSIVGMLLGHEEKHRVVHSMERSGFLQHDVYSWEVERDHFVYMSETTQSSRAVDAALKEWLQSMDEKQRGAFVDDVYAIMTETNARTLKDLSSNWLTHARGIMTGLKNMDEPTRKNMIRALTLLLQSAKKGIDTVYRQEK